MRITAKNIHHKRHGKLTVKSDKTQAALNTPQPSKVGRPEHVHEDPAFTPVATKRTTPKRAITKLIAISDLESLRSGDVRP